MSAVAETEKLRILVQVVQDLQREAETKHKALEDAAPRRVRASEAVERTFPIAAEYGKARAYKRVLEVIEALERKAESS